VRRLALGISCGRTARAVSRYVISSKLCDGAASLW
jgi:hypothetical protein